MSQRLFWIGMLLALTLSIASAQALEVQEVKTKGGVTAWLVEDHSLPLVAARIAFREAGRASDMPGGEGRAYLTGELLMEGAGEMDALSFQKAMESHAIHLSTGVDEDFMRVSMESLTEHLPVAFDLLGGMLTKARFDEEALTRVRRAALTQLSQLEPNPSYMLQRAWAKAAYGTHPYANPPYGTAESLPKLTAPALRDYTQRYLTRGNIVIGVTGDINAAQLKALLEKHLDGLPASFRPEKDIPEVSLPAKGQTIVVKKAIPQTLAAFGLTAPKRTDEDYFPAFIMNQILGGGGSLNSRLGDEIREKRGLAYYINSQIDGALHSGSLNGSFGTRSAEVKNANALLREGFAAMQKDGVTEQELREAKQYLTGSFVLNLDSNEDVASYLISMQIYNLGRDYFDKRNRLIEAVTRERINQLAKALLDPQKLLIVLVGNIDDANAAHAQ